jgi:hypothetical protein
MAQTGTGKKERKKERQKERNTIVRIFFHLLWFTSRVPISPLSRYNIVFVLNLLYEKRVYTQIKNHNLKVHILLEAGTFLWNIFIPALLHGSKAWTLTAREIQTEYKQRICVS